ncbi:Fungalysin metallopeptidase-domain-containing protein [Stachybotrys elegans]|uniref:Extracellular metalloproteinase n=1 Tax=Stachybotrys elegans TaxID=80388 RepID=A0A8K0T0E7_9HYPO|nr:Fungalysin metallopeptidase-domain-containing protein [Stachybotrys elegans]
MKSVALLGLAGLAANVQAHSHAADASRPSLSKRGVEIESFRMPQLSEYSTSEESKSVAGSLAKRDTYVEAATDLVKAVAPSGATFRLVDDHYVGTNGIAHVNFKQTIHGIDIDNADFNVNVNRDGTIFSYGNSFYHGEIPESPLQKRDFSDPVQALEGAVGTLGLAVTVEDPSVEEKPEARERYTVKGVSGTVSDPEARLVYLRKADGSLALTWRVETDVVDNWLLTYVDANNNGEIHGVVDYVSDMATFEVYPWAVREPTRSSRTLVEDPWVLEASPFTWLGDGGANYTTTWGNNAIAHVNPSGRSTNLLDNYRPDAPNLEFEWDFSLDMTDPTEYWNASITQLWYTANQFHDLLYILGFNEAAGNFQTNNNGLGGRGNDAVILNSQDGSGRNNANFAVPPDGTPGRMRMFLFTYAPILRDSSFDAGVVLHEYAHGLSVRLTGGPLNSGCLSGGEAGGMGEGWSDFMSIAIQLLPESTRNDDVPMWPWIFNNPNGARIQIYSTNMNTNDLTYGTINRLSGITHETGTVWNTMLFEVLWNLIDKHGKNDADFPDFDGNGVPTDGKFLAIKLAIDAMALQPCTPTFVSARDAILDADRALTGGDNLCEIWTGFAKRGLGQNAQYNSGRRVEDFTVPGGVC